MSTQNETTNGQSSTEKQTSEADNTKSTTAKSSTRREAKSSIVKTDDKDNGEVVFVLNDSTRLVPTEYLPNHRPIALSNFDVVGSLDMAGDRPIMSNDFEVATTDMLPGHRPVAVSNLPISELNFLPGNRPIASNDVVDPIPSVLMGYLD